MKNTTSFISPVRRKRIAVAVYGLALATTLGIAYSQNGPAGAKGASSRDAASIRFDNQVGEQTGRQLRVR
jgi:hypothetical protein